MSNPEGPRFRSVRARFKASLGGGSPTVQLLENRVLLTVQPPAMVQRSARTVALHQTSWAVEAQLRATALAVLTTDALAAAFYTRTAAAVQSGRISMAQANLQILRQPAARSVIAQGLWTQVFQAAPTTAQLRPYVTARNSQAGMKCLLIQMAASPDYYASLGGNPAAYRAGVSDLMLGGRAFPPRLASAPVATTPQRTAGEAGSAAWIPADLGTDPGEGGQQFGDVHAPAVVAGLAESPETLWHGADPRQPAHAPEVQARYCGAGQARHSNHR